MPRKALPQRAPGAALKPLILGLFLLPALVPLLRVDALPCTHDNIFHAYRIVAMRGMLDHGWFFSRWVPDLALGYGYPFFNYREPLPYLAGEILYAGGLPLPLVLGLLYGASLVGAAWGAYVLARDLFGERAAWVAGIAYGLGPYVLLDPLRRGNMPESVALALIPWLFVTTRRLILRKTHRDFVVTLLLLVTLFLSHNISSLLLAPFLGFYVALLSWRHRARAGWPYVFAAVGLAVLLTAWFWLPALTEQGYVQLHLSRTTRNNDFHYNFVTWREMLLTLPAPYDPAYLNPPMRIAVGVGQVLLGAAGALVAVTRRVSRKRRALVLLLAVSATIYLWLASPGSVGLWDRVPLLSFVQFPWRLVGRALLPISLLAGLAVEHWTVYLGSRRDNAGAVRSACALPMVVLAVAVVLLTVLAWPDTYPPKGMCAAESYPDLGDLYARELDGWLGMDPESSYFPVWVETHPGDTTLADAFERGELPERFDEASLPQGGEVLSAAYGPLSAHLTVSAPAGFRARWLGLYFPGWQVRVDGRPVPVDPEDGTGMLTFDVPAGEHRVDVRFGMTPIRRLGTALSAAGVASTAALAFLSWLRSRRARSPDALVAGVDDAAGPDTDILLPRRAAPRAGVMLAMALGLLMVRVLVLDRVPSPVSRSRLAAGDLPEIAAPLDVAFSGGLRLLGATLDESSVAADGELSVDLLWKADAAPAADYRTTVLFRGGDGQIWSPAGTSRPRGYESPTPTRGWRSGQYAFDPHLVTALAGAPPGRYRVVVAVFDEDTLVPASVLGSDGEPQGPDFVLGEIELTSPSDTADLNALGVPEGSRLTQCGTVGLWQMTLDRAVGVPGDVVAVRWVWESLSASDGDLAATLVLLAPDDAPVHAWTLPMVTDEWPTTLWQAGQRWVGRHVVRLPGDLDSGDHRLAVTVDGCGGVPLAEVPLGITAPERTFAVPERFAPVGVTFGGVIDLAGVVLPDPVLAPGEQMLVDLAWQARSAIDVSYRVFLHLLDADGRLVDQSDGEPVAWTRPTTGWAQGEVVTESRQVRLPADATGDYLLRVGFYAPGEARLLTAEGEDGYVLASIHVE